MHDIRSKTMKNDSFIDFDGKWIAVSGASSGIGRAIVHQLYNLGANIVLLGRDLSRMEVTSEGLTAGRFLNVKLDLNEIETIQPVLAAVKIDIGKFYGLCHSAGTVTTLPLNASKYSAANDMMRVNFFAGLELARTITRRDFSEDNGSIVFISSIYSHVGAPGQIAYCASKGAVCSSVKAMAVELARRKIKVNSISPGFIQTEMTVESMSLLNQKQVDAIIEKHPLGAGTPAEIARMAAFLLSPKNKWITGADFILDGGYTAQ
jgi:NAD(P)-dependent dehydrogenase (short-subunit alcohol dehydrogenase family)